MLRGNWQEEGQFINCLNLPRAVGISSTNSYCAINHQEMNVQCQCHLRAAVSHNSSYFPSVQSRFNLTISPTKFRNDEILLKKTIFIVFSFLPSVYISGWRRCLVHAQSLVFRFPQFKQNQHNSTQR